MLQHQIMKPAKRKQVEFLNGNTLDCQRSNLRVAAPSQVQAHSRLYSTNQTGYRGVIVPHGRHRWRACIKVKGKRIHGGSYDTPEEAARIYDALAKKYFKELAMLNFPQENSKN